MAKASSSFSSPRTHLWEALFHSFFYLLAMALPLLKRRACSHPHIAPFSSSSSSSSSSSLRDLPTLLPPPDPCSPSTHPRLLPLLLARHLSQLAPVPANKRAFVVDTLSLVRKLEAQDLPAKQAEAITSVITEVLNDSLENVAQSFATTAEMQRSEMIREAALSNFKGEMQGSQDNHFAALQRETERLRTDIDKLRSELRYEIDKVSAGQRLDLNLERGRIREELANQNEETQNLTNKLDKEIHTLKTQVEAAKYDVIKYCIGTIVSVTAVGLGILRILL